MDNNPNPSGAPQASYPYPPAKPQIPGKGQGIVGLVMSIIGVLQSFGLIWVMLSVFILSLLDASSYSYSFTGQASFL